LLLQCLSALAQGVVIQLLYLGVNGFYLLNEWLDKFHVAAGFVTKQRLQKFVEIHI
jgi:hypothetical protein